MSHVRRKVTKQKLASAVKHARATGEPHRHVGACRVGELQALDHDVALQATCAHTFAHFAIARR